MVRKKRKRTPEEVERDRQFRQQSDENLRRLRELVDLGWKEIEEKGIPTRIPPPSRTAS